jgi:hypothetical protein
VLFWVIARKSERNAGESRKDKQGLKLLKIALDIFSTCVKIAIDIEFCLACG